MKSIYNLRKWAVFFLVLSILASILFASLLSKADINSFHFNSQKPLIENIHQLTLSAGPLIIFCGSAISMVYFFIFLFKSNKNRFNANQESELDSHLSETKIGFRLSGIISSLQIIAALCISSIVAEILFAVFERDLTNTISAFIFLAILGFYGFGMLFFVLFTFRNKYIQFGF